MCAVNPDLGTITSQTEIICSGSLLGFGLGLNVVFPGFIMGKKSPEMLDHNTAVLPSMGKLIYVFLDYSTKNIVSCLGACAVGFKITNGDCLIQKMA